MTGYRNLHGGTWLVRRAILSAGLAGTQMLSGQTSNVTTQHSDNYRTGAYLAETKLTPAAVLARGMQVKWQHPVDGPLAAQPLYVQDTVSGNPFGAVFVATSPNNTVYALDPDTGAEMWHKTLVDSNPSSRPLPRGVTSTPVIDICNHTLYVLFSTKNQASDGSDTPQDEANLVLNGLDVAYWLVALDYQSGTEVARVQISASVTRSNGSVLNFVAKDHWNRPALLLDHGFVYLAFGMRPREEVEDYHGWVIRYRESDLVQDGVFCTSKDATVPSAPYTYHTAEGAGIWQGGGGLSADPAGNVYFLAGNGTANTTNGWYGDSFIKLTPTLTANGTILVPTAYTPPGAATMYANDADLGSGGAMVLPSTNLVIGGGKTGYMYLLNRTSMALAQQLTAATNQYDPSLRDQNWAAGPHLHGSPTYWRGPDPTFGYLYVWGEKDYLRLYRFNTTTSLIESNPAHVGSILALETTMPGGMMSVSADGNKPGTGIVWATLPEAAYIVPGTSNYPGHLYAFNAETLVPLWDKSFSSLGKWLSPTIANGNVFVGTSSNQLIAYELVPAPHKKPSHGHGHYTYKPHKPIGPGPKIVPLHKRYADEESIQALSSVLLSKLAPPQGSAMILALRAEGTLLYHSTKVDGEPGWQLSSAIADLYEAKPEDLRSKKAKRTIIRLSPGPTWTAPDGSSIVGELEKTVRAPDKTAAPWVLFKITRRAGKGMLTPVEYVEGVFTESGLSPEELAGKSVEQRVPYKANYVFYRGR